MSDLEADLGVLRVTFANDAAVDLEAVQEALLELGAPPGAELDAGLEMDREPGGAELEARLGEERLESPPRRELDEGANQVL